MDDKLREALKEYVSWAGGMHDDACPEDDTCDCKGKWVNDTLNAWLAAPVQAEVVKDVRIKDGDSLREALVSANTATNILESVPAEPHVICESCHSTNTERYENAGGLKMYYCQDCSWHDEVAGAPVQAAG